MPLGIALMGVKRQGYSAAQWKFIATKGEYEKTLQFDAIQLFENGAREIDGGLMQSDAIRRLNSITICIWALFREATMQTSE